MSLYPLGRACPTCGAEAHEFCAKQGAFSACEARWEAPGSRQESPENGLEAVLTAARREAKVEAIAALIHDYNPGISGREWPRNAASAILDMLAGPPQEKPRYRPNKGERPETMPARRFNRETQMCENPREKISYGLSTCDTCGKVLPSAPPGVIHKCTCTGGMMVPNKEPEA